MSVWVQRSEDWVENVTRPSWTIFKVYLRAMREAMESRNSARDRGVIQLFLGACQGGLRTEVDAGNLTYHVVAGGGDVLRMEAFFLRLSIKFLTPSRGLANRRF